jgi:hypothetical protein
VLDPGLVAEAAAHVTWLEQRHAGELRPEMLGHFLVADDPFWVRLVSDDRLLDVAEQFIGPDIALFASHYIAKPPGDGQPVLWHQDASYWPLDPMEVVSLWLAVDPATTENGCLRVIPGSHLLPAGQLRAVTDVDNVLSSETTHVVHEDAAVDLVLAPGDVEVHHPNLLHGSGANRSAHRRAGLTIRYIPTSTRITEPGAGCPMLLRGRAVPGVNEYLPPPVFDRARHFPFAAAQATA